MGAYFQESRAGFHLVGRLVCMRIFPASLTASLLFCAAWPLMSKCLLWPAFLADPLLDKRVRLAH